MPELVCPKCEHSKDWEHGNYFGERTDFEGVLSSPNICGTRRL
jgi:hypothetical protein